MSQIYNGSFVLGNTSATTLSAGPGITIDSPSAGTVRIGNDETVLWETATSATSGTLSESPSNFESLKFYCIDDHNRSCVLELYNPGTNTAVGNTYSIATPDSASNSMRTIQCILNGSTFDVYGQQMSITTGKVISWVGGLGKNNYSFATKVVGINRISGGNE